MNPPNYAGVVANEGYGLVVRVIGDGGRIFIRRDVATFTPALDPLGMPVCFQGHEDYYLTNDFDSREQQLMGFAASPGYQLFYSFSRNLLGAASGAPNKEFEVVSGTSSSSVVTDADKIISFYHLFQPWFPVWPYSTTKLLEKYTYTTYHNGFPSTWEKTRTMSLPHTVGGSIFGAKIKRVAELPL